jgi:transposase
MVDTPDYVISHSPPLCEACGTDLSQVTPQDTQRRQVFDLPKLALEVTEHQLLVKSCPCCGQTNRGSFPEAVTQPVQYGERVKAIAVYLLVYQLIPYDRLTQLMSDLLAVPLSEGTLQNAVETCASRLEGVEAKIQAGIQHAEQAHFDETGGRIGGKRGWVHVAGTAYLTHYGWHGKRGRAATEAIGILPGFEGRAMHDGWRSYFGYPCDHALCNAHHLRELTFLEEQCRQEWARRLKELLVRIYRRVEEVREAGGEALKPEERVGFEEEYEAIVAAGEAANPKPAEMEGNEGKKKGGRRKQTPAQNMLDRLRSYRKETLAFMYDFGVPFDNNQAERDLRMVKVQQKISGGFRSEAGAKRFCRIRGYVSTLRKQAMDVMGALEQVFRGQPVVPGHTPG